MDLNIYFFVFLKSYIFDTKSKFYKNFDFLLMNASKYSILNLPIIFKDLYMKCGLLLQVSLQ